VAGKSSIEWTEATWNPATGCDRITRCCDNCYALTLAKRLKAEPLPGPIDDLDLTGIDWLIAGGESGPGHVGAARAAPTGCLSGS
jgi:protein gp37